MLSWTFEAGTATNDGSTGQDLSCGSSYDSLCAGGAPSGNTAKVSFNFDPNNGLVGSNDGQYFHRFVTVWINLDGYVSVEVHYRSNPSPTQSGYVHYCNSSASITDGTEIEVPYSSHEVIAGPYTVINAKPSSVYVTVNL